MIRKVLHYFPSPLATHLTAFSFASKRPDPKKNFTPPNTSRKLEILIRKYIIKLQAQVRTVPNAIDRKNRATRD